MANYLPQTYANTYTPYLYGAPSTNSAMTATPTYNQEQTSAINWVQGEAGARSVPVAPGQKAILMDSETNIFYLKSVDTSGMPLPLRIFEYTEVGKVAEKAESDDGAPKTYVTHEELEQRLSELKIDSKEEKKNDFLI